MKGLLFVFALLSAFAQAQPRQAFQSAMLKAATADTIRTDGSPTIVHLSEAPYTYDTVRVVYQYIDDTGLIVSGKGYEVVKRYLSGPGVQETVVGAVARLDKKKKLLPAGRMASVPIRFNWK